MVHPGIYLVKFKDSYKMAMYCLRYQEFYESPSNKFRNKSFTIFEYMEWYAKKYGSFSYPQDWGGFNFPSYILTDVYKKGIPDKNLYDEHMLDIYSHCLKLNGNNNFYMIFSCDNKTTNHEIAHGLFYLNKEYNKKMKDLVKSLPDDVFLNVKNILKKLGYTPKVYIDECQAYFATGLTNQMSDVLSDTDKVNYSNKFKKIFNDYNKKTK